MLKLKSILLALFALTLLNACATRVKSIKSGAQTNLKSAEGYLLLAVDTTMGLEKIYIKGRKSVALGREDLMVGSNYILLAMPAGRYYFDRIVLFSIFNTSAYVDLEPDMWRFKVTQNKINYIGHLELGKSSWRRDVDMVLVNNSTAALLHMEDKFANLLDQQQIIYNGPGKDDFFDQIRSMPQDIVNTTGAQQCAISWRFCCYGFVLLLTWRKLSLLKVSTLLFQLVSSPWL